MNDDDILMIMIKVILPYDKSNEKKIYEQQKRVW